MGLDSDAAAASVTPTYDLSCPPGVDSSTHTDICPFGSVQNVFKEAIGARIASQIMVGIGRRHSNSESVVAAGQRAQWAGPGLLRVNTSGSSGSDVVTVQITYDTQIALAPTLNCVACCSRGRVGDFDVSFNNGTSWVNGSRPVLVADNPKALVFIVSAPTSQEDHTHHSVSRRGVTHVRYTANQPFPQCAVYSGVGEAGIPAMPFRVGLAQGWGLPKGERPESVGTIN